MIKVDRLNDDGTTTEVWLSNRAGKGREYSCLKRVGILVGVDEDDIPIYEEGYIRSEGYLKYLGMGSYARTDALVEYPMLNGEDRV